MKKSNKNKFKIFNTPIKIIFSFFTFLFFIFFFPGFGIEFMQYKYVGVTKCVSSCHRTEKQGKQLEIWKNSKHSNAWKTLKSEQAKKVAEKSGYNTAPIEIPECVRCHLLGKETISEELSVTFEKEEGVQCESCHGAGSEYIKISVMKDRQKAVEKGLIIYDNKEDLCNKCHNNNSPTFKGFDFESYWNQIKHYKQ